MDRLTAAGAIAAPTVHTVTDVMEWVHGGFTPLQPRLNYLAFLPLPAVLQTVGTLLDNVGLVRMGWALALGASGREARST